MNNEPRTKAAIYAWLPIKHDKRINEQINFLITIAREKGDGLAGIYIDNGATQSLFKRPGFKRLLRGAKGRGFTKLYLLDVARLSREQVELVTAYEWLKRNGIATIVVKNPKAQITL